MICARVVGNSLREDAVLRDLGFAVVEAFQKLKDIVPHCVVTDGPAGAYIRFGGGEYHVPAFPCEPKDLTGGNRAIFQVTVSRVRWSNIDISQNRRSEAIRDRSDT